MRRVGIGLVQFTSADGPGPFAADLAAQAVRRRGPGPIRSRFFRLADEQLLPARSVDAGHTHLAVFETDDLVALAELAATIGMPALVTGSFAPGTDVRASCMDLVLDTTEPSFVPTGDEPPAFPGEATGHPGLFCSFTRPASPADEDAYNRWWTEVHLRDTLLLTGMERGRRYRRAADLQPATTPVPHDYLAMYDIDAVGRVPWQRATLPRIAELSAQPMTDALDRTSVRGFTYEQLWSDDEERR